VRTYADPLYEAARSLSFRLDEIVQVRNPGYLLSSTPATAFIDYKRLSTSYRLAALLGWIRAFRRERSYLDAQGHAEGEETQVAISRIEAALADGQHVEDARLRDLLALRREYAAAPMVRPARSSVLQPGHERRNHFRRAPRSNQKIV
jgi:hypothetical protein